MFVLVVTTCFSHCQQHLRQQGRAHATKFNNYEQQSKQQHHQPHLQHHLQTFKATASSSVVILQNVGKLLQHPSKTADSSKSTNQIKQIEYATTSMITLVCAIFFISSFSSSLRRIDDNKLF